MQDHGVVVEDFKNQSVMENLSISSSGENQDSARSLPHDPDTTSLDEIDEHPGSKENSISPSRDMAKLPNEQNLPENITSNYENIPLNYAKDGENMPSHDDSTIAAKNDEKFVQSDEEKVSNFTEIIFTDNHKVTNEEKSIFGKDSDVSTVTNSNSRKNSVFSPNERDSCKIFDVNPGEPSIEDSCESQPAYSCENNAIERSIITEDTKQRTNCAEKPSMLSDDSRLVKISLPTSSMNIMQTNAQFLNKSRNFLNFITEKSTNIMEKTLLPQNLAIRYNSILKMTESTGCQIDKKNLQESSIIHESSIESAFNSQTDGNSESLAIVESPRNDVAICDEEEEKKEEENITESKINESFQALEANSNDKFFTNSVTSASIGEFVSTRLVDNSPLTNECYSSSDKSPETNTDSGSKKLNDAGKEILHDDKCFIEDSIERGNESSIDSCNSLLRHPVYLTLVRDYARIKEEKLRLADSVDSLEAKNRILEAQNSCELFNVQLETLEKTVERLTVELRGAIANKEELGREYTAANKERESMVMKYAVSEKQLIDTQRARDYAERRYKEIAKDYELLQNKLRQAQSERTRICNILDAKCRELTDSQKEVERLKEDVNVRDVKLKWTQTKLKTEMESQKETQLKLDKATARINDMKEECEQVRRESQEMIRKFQHSEENKAVTLDQQLKEQQARLIMERHVTEDKEILRLQLQKEVDLLKNRQLGLIEENNTLSLKIQDLEKKRLSYEGKLSDLKNLADQRQKEIVDLSAKVSHLETLKLQLIHKEQCLMSNEAEVERLRQVNQELQVDMDCCRQREAHMLDFTQKLTDKNVRLQSEFTSIEAKSAQLEHEQGPLRESIVEFKTRLKELEENLSYERNKRTEECEILARHLAEQTQIAQNLTQKLEESEGEIAVLRRKQQISVKEMSRELQQCRKKLETYESASPSNSLDPTSRAGSNNSLNAGEALNGATSDNSVNGEPTRQSADLDRQSLIDRILKMQKINVRRAEKLDFLEEHTRTLVAELQKKTKIIQNYIMHENFDAMGSNERDRHKAELARYGGIMASVYSHRVSDDNMTLELSLEINQKLQAVLEDALLKNITLKDNIDTLGEEIARLTIRNQQMLQQKGK